MIVQNPMHVTCPYEVGDILQTTNATAPSTRWPGTTWQQIADCFIRAADSSHPAESTGGSWSHTQTVDELAAHSHTFSPLNTPIVDTGIADAQFGLHFSEGVSSYRANPGNINGAGSSNPMDITNKYYSAYIWRRTA